MDRSFLMTIAVSFSAKKPAKRSRDAPGGGDQRVFGLLVDVLHAEDSLDKLILVSKSLSTLPSKQHPYGG